MKCRSCARHCGTVLAKPDVVHAFMDLTVYQACQGLIMSRNSVRQVFHGESMVQHKHLSV